MSESAGSTVDWEAARAEFEDGASVNSIAKRYGVTRAAVYWQARERGWQRSSDAASLVELTPFDAILVRWARWLLRTDAKIQDAAGGRFADSHLLMRAESVAEQDVIRAGISEIMGGPPA